MTPLPPVNCYEQLTLTLLNPQPFDTFEDGVLFCMFLKQGRYLVMDANFQKMVVTNMSHHRYIPPFHELKRRSAPLPGAIVLK